MFSIGTSAYIKLLCLNPRPQRSELKKRLLPREGGYDFHASLRARAKSYLLDGVDFPTIVESLSDISREPERRSAQAGLQALRQWRTQNPGRIVELEQKAVTSPRGLFRVRFQPNFGIESGRQTVGVHIWNNGSPDLQRLMVYRALALFEPVMEEMRVDDLALLSLRSGHVLRLSDVDSYGEMAVHTAYAIEELLLDLREELSLPPAQDESGLPIRR